MADIGTTQTKPGHGKTTPDSEDDLVRRHIRLVWLIALREVGRLPPCAHRDDIFASGLWGLLQAIRSYRDDMGVDLRSHARARIRGQILDDIRTTAWVGRADYKRRGTSGIPAIYHMSSYEEEFQEELDVAGSNGSPSHEPDHRDLMEWAQNRLSRQWADILRLHCDHGMTMREIAEVVGLTESRVCQVWPKIQRRLNSAMQDDELRLRVRPVNG